MEYHEKPISVYIETSEKGYITKIFSSIFEEATEKSIKIDEGYGDKFAHAQNLYLGKPLYNEHGELRYKYEGGKIYEQS